MLSVVYIYHIRTFQAALGLNIKYKEVSALTGEGVEDVSYVCSIAKYTAVCILLVCACVCVCVCVHACVSVCV